ncbi:MAG: TaqI-like C-terminal specificity domain-containing protein, partial [Romboutsia sp.]|uniref:TaqI-like C-terminal specificity domain-containing protein n=1 Tax=Romboutsia sp. TaxID=1965302 RepID=UPI003F37F5F8
SVKIDEIVDFLGCSIFKNIGICSCIVTLKKVKIDNNIKIYKIRDENLNLDNTLDLDTLIQSNKFESFNINQGDLVKKWLIVNERDKLFIENLESKCDYSLENIATSFQGIITGCDKAFIIKENDEKIENINKLLLKPWVKNKSINKYIVNKSEKKLLYSNDIDIEKNYPFEINEIIGIYKEKLLKRRECQKNVRKWYELQWGREKYLFEQKKIMYPYKCSENRFAIDYDNNFCSADVYSFFIKDDHKDEFSYEYLVGILNSSIYDKYFKISAKKISKNIYDYYPNKVMKLKIFKDENYNAIEKLSNEIINKLKYSKDTQIEIQNLQSNLDNLIKESLAL